MSKRLNICLASALFASVQVFSATATLAAGARGSEAEAQEMVKKAVALIKSAGPDSAYKTFTEHPSGAFKDRDLYVFVYDFQGICLAQGANPKIIGKNLIELKDADGKPTISGMIDVVKTKKTGWYGPYRFNNPVTNTLEAKKSYCEQGAGETMVCVGAYLGKSSGRSNAASVNGSALPDTAKRPRKAASFGPLRQDATTWALPAR